MPGPRVIVHAGFHKTGTTSVQKFLRANGKHIYPRCALVLPGRLRKGAARMAVRYSQHRTPGLLDQFAADLHDVLSKIEVKNRAVLISDENLAGRMPGRDGQTEYGAAPVLMARAEEVICDVFGAEADVVFHFTTRDPQDWLRSTYKHNLRTSRLVLDWDEYQAAYTAASDLTRVTQSVAEAVTGAVHHVDLETLNGPFGPADPLIEQIGLPTHLRKRLTPHPAQNTGPADDLIDALLALNRADLSDEARHAAKTDLLGKATDDER